MVSGDRVQGGGELSSAARLQLISVNLEAESGPARCLENSARLFDGEYTRLAEHVGEAGDALLDDLWQQSLDQELDELATPLVARAVFMGDLVRPEPRGHD